MLPYFVAGPLIAAGRLSPVLAGQLGGKLDVALVYPERPHLPKAVQAFIEVVVGWARQEHARYRGR